jgi:hypothetical protein
MAAKKPATARKAPAPKKTMKASAGAGTRQRKQSSRKR